jgi:cytochrome oxidase Cu insertion factor (SCO1/SenC/PrrC family)
VNTTSIVLVAVAVLLVGAGVALRAASRAGARGAAEAAAGSLRPGMPAPDFTLDASDGHTYRLADFKGRQAVVIAWFPKAFTGG